MNEHMAEAIRRKIKSQKLGVNPKFLEEIKDVGIETVCRDISFDISNDIIAAKKYKEIPNELIITQIALLKILVEEWANAEQARIDIN